MAVITKRAFLRHLQAGPTSHVRQFRRGKLTREGTALSFWFRPLGTSIAELPTEELERSILFRARTSDYQEVSVQATVTYRIEQADLAANRIDFSIDTDGGHWNQTPLEQLGGVLTEMAQHHSVSVLAEMTLAEVLVGGIRTLRSAIAEGLAADSWLADAGIAVVGVRVIAVRPEADIEKALQNPVREHLQQEADRATFERRALAVQQERAIGENELKNRIELARREEELVTQEGANQRRRVSEEAEAARISTEAKARDLEVTATANAQRTRLLGSASAEAERAKFDALESVADSTLLALAARELAGHLPAVDTLVLTPELITPLLAKLVSTSGSSAEKEG